MPENQQIQQTQRTRTIPNRRVGPVGIHVASRLKLRRFFMNMSLAEVAGRFDPPISWQQMHKYENGENRLTCDRLAELARIYRWDVPSMFDNSPIEIMTRYRAPTLVRASAAMHADAHLVGLMQSPTGIVLLRVLADLSERSRLGLITFVRGLVRAECTDRVQRRLGLEAVAELQGFTTSVHKALEARKDDQAAA